MKYTILLTAILSPLFLGLLFAPIAGVTYLLAIMWAYKTNAFIRKIWRRSFREILKLENSL